MKEFVRSGFLGQWSVEAQRFEQQKAASASEVANLESEQRRVVKLLSDTPLTRVEATVRIPSGAARLGFVCLVTSLVFLSLLAVANAAAYLRFLTQGWLVAVLMVAPLLFVALPVKYVMGKLGDKGRRRLGWIIACLGVVAFFGFLFTLSARANEPSCADVLNGTAGLGARLVPWQLAAQVLLETVIAAALWCWIINLTVTSSRQVQNSDVAMLAAERDRLQEGINAARKRLAEAMGNLSELSHSLEYWLCYAETIYHAYSERERRLAECLVPVRDWPRTAGI
jgi:cobalamin biosynthesis protein CobD/CbiB